MTLSSSSDWKKIFALMPTLVLGFLLLVPYHFEVQENVSEFLYDAHDDGTQAKKNKKLF